LDSIYFIPDFLPIFSLAEEFFDPNSRQEYSTSKGVAVICRYRLTTDQLWLAIHRQIFEAQCAVASELHKK
jgi:hypothetical protein